MAGREAAWGHALELAGTFALSRRRLVASTYEPKFAQAAPASSTRNRVLFATGWRRRNRSSRDQPSHLSHGWPWNTPGCQPSRASHIPRHWSGGKTQGLPGISTRSLTFYRTSARRGSLPEGLRGCLLHDPGRAARAGQRASPAGAASAGGPGGRGRRQISGGFRSAQRARACPPLRCVLATARQQGLPHSEALRPEPDALLAGLPG